MATNDDNATGSGDFFDEIVAGQGIGEGMGNAAPGPMESYMGTPAYQAMIEAQTGALQAQQRVALAQAKQYEAYVVKSQATGILLVAIAFALVLLATAGVLWVAFN